jgi:predicted GNAT family N-acyltransferase
MCSTCTQPTTARASAGQAFYRRHGFVPDGTPQVADGVREIRMVRDVQHSAVTGPDRL